MNTYVTASQVQLIPFEVYRHNPLSFHSCYPSLISDLITPHPNDCSSLFLACMQIPPIYSAYCYSSHYIWFICPSPPCSSESGWSLISPARAAATTCPLSSVNIPALNPYPSAQTPPPVSSVFCIYVNLLTPDEFWEHTMACFGFCLFLMMPRERHTQSKQLLWNWIKSLEREQDTIGKLATPSEGILWEQVMIWKERVKCKCTKQTSQSVNRETTILFTQKTAGHHCLETTFMLSSWIEYILSGLWTWVFLLA